MLLIIMYLLRNKCNTLVYIGQTENTLKQRWKDGYKGCIRLERAMNKLGKENFYYEIIGIYDNQEEGDNAEIYFIAQYDSTNPAKGYNIMLGGKLHGKHSEETKKKIGDAHRGEKSWAFGKQKSDETKKKISEAKKGQISPFLGKHHSDETKKKLSDAHIGLPAWNKGIPMTDEQRKKSSEAHKGLQVGDKNPFYGKTHTDETKEKIAVSRRGKSSWNKSIQHSDETKKKISEAGKGRQYHGQNNKLTKDIAIEIRTLYATNKYTYATLGEMYNVSAATISNIINNKAYI